MIRRILTVLTPALFALPLLLAPTSQVYADADGITSVYSGLECKYLMSYATEGQREMNGVGMGLSMMGGDVFYHPRLGIGNAAERSREEDDPRNPDPSPRPGIDPPPGDTKQYRMTVACPLPSLMDGAEVAIAAIDGTVFDDVTCRVQSCVAGIGVGEGGEGGCIDGPPSSTHPAGSLQTQEEPLPYSQPEKYITQNVDWFVVEAPMAPDHVSKGNRREPFADPDLGEVYSHLLCTLPERDDVSPEAPGIYPSMPNREHDKNGISYIQSYYVMN